MNTICVGNQREMKRKGVCRYRTTGQQCLQMDVNVQVNCPATWIGRSQGGAQPIYHKPRTISHSYVQTDNNRHRPTCRQSEPMNYHPLIVLHESHLTWLPAQQQTTGSWRCVYQGRGAGVEHPLLARHPTSARATSPRVTVVTENTRNLNCTREKRCTPAQSLRAFKMYPFCSFIFFMGFSVRYRNPVDVDSVLKSAKTYLCRYLYQFRIYGF
jgi:hypothetical protein